MDENAFFRAARIDLKPDATITIFDPKADVVLIAGNGANLVISRAGQSSTMAGGDSEFVAQGTRTTVSSVKSAGSLIVAKLKRHWDAPMRQYTEPKKCRHDIVVSGAAIGESATLFSNGFVTVYRHRLDRGGTLGSSHFSSSGQHHLLLIALTDLEATLEGRKKG